MNPIGQSVIRRSGERAFRNWQQLLDEWDERWCQASLTFCQQIRRFFFVFANSVIWCRAEDWASWMWQLLIRTTHIRRRFIPFIAVHFCLFFFSSLFWLIRRVHNTDFPIQCEWCTLFIYLRCFLFDMFVGRFCFFFFCFSFSCSASDSARMQTCELEWRWSEWDLCSGWSVECWMLMYVCVRRFSNIRIHGGVVWVMAAGTSYAPNTKRRTLFNPSMVWGMCMTWCMDNCVFVRAPDDILSRTLYETRSSWACVMCA